jgi:hypothetical protein
VAYRFLVRSMLRLLALLVTSLLLSSCLWPILGDPGMAITHYVITGTAADARRATDVIREVASANGLYLYTEPKPGYRFREYRNRDARGLASLLLDVDPRRPTMISISEGAEKPTALHRQVAHDLETRLTQAGIPFHKPSADERLRLEAERAKKKT